MTSIQDLCAIRYLRKAVEECQAYDGWTDDEMLAHFIQKNGFNPIEELKQTKKRLIKKYCSKEIEEEIEFACKSKDLDLDRLNKLQSLIDELDIDRTVRNIIYDLYTV